MRRGGLHPREIYDYLVEARARVLGRVGQLTVRQYATPFPFGRRTIRETLYHVVETEWYYNRLLRRERVVGDPFRPLRETSFPPLAKAWARQSEETRQTLAGVSDWGAPVESHWTGLKWIHGLRTTAGGVATQLLLHEVHHRAQVMVMLRRLGKPIQRIDFNLLTWDWYTTEKGAQAR